MEQQEQHERAAPSPEKKNVNGIDTDQLFANIEAVKADPAKGRCTFSATTRWKHGTVSDCEVSRYELGGEVIPQNYSIRVDEPAALLGTDEAPNPQMVLFAAINSCVLNTFVINAAAHGIHLESVEMDIQGELDLRGFLGIDDAINPGYDELRIICRVRGDGTREQLQQCLDAGTRYSPNFQTTSRPVNVKYELELA